MSNPFSSGRFSWANPAKLFTRRDTAAAPAPAPQAHGSRFAAPPPRTAPAPESAQSRFIPPMGTRSSQTGAQGGRGILGSILQQLGEPRLSRMNSAQWAELFRPFGVQLKPGADPAERWQEVRQQLEPLDIDRIFASSASTQQLLDLLQTPPHSAKPAATAGRRQASETADLSQQVSSIGIDALQHFSTADWRALLSGCSAKVPLGVDPAARWAQLAQLRDPQRFASVIVNPHVLQRVLTRPVAAEQIPRLDQADRRQWAALLAEQGHRLPPGADPEAAWKRIREKFNDQEVERVLDKYPQALLRVLLAQNGATGA